MIGAYGEVLHEDHRFTINHPNRVGIILKSAYYRALKKRVIPANREYDVGYHASFRDIRASATRFFHFYPDYSLLIHVIGGDHSTGIFMYRRNDKFNFIVYNPNWVHRSDKTIAFLKYISSSLHGFFQISPPDSNPTGKCLGMTYSFFRDIMSGTINPKTEMRCHWFCLSRMKRIYSELTEDDCLMLYPANNKKVVHGFNRRRKCKVWAKKNSEACNGCNYRELGRKYYELPPCGLCEGPKKKSPMFIAL